MNQHLHLTPVEIQRAGWEALKKELGLTGALRFLLQYERGEGDYTKLRRKLFKGETVESLTDKMRKRRRTSENSKRTEARKSQRSESQSSEGQMSEIRE